MSGKILAVDRALDILNYLFNEGEEVGISQISRDLDIPKSTVHRTLTTLEGKHFVYKNTETEKYWLGMKIYAMGEMVKENITLIDIIKPHAEALYEKVGEVINVSILDIVPNESYKGTVIFKKTGTTNVLSVNPKVGSGADAHTSSVGKCLLAYNTGLNLEEARENMELRAYTENTIDNWDDLLIELEKVREKGYSVDNEEREIGLFCIGAPILDKNNNAIAAISISGPTTRMKQVNMEENIEKLKQTAKDISRDLRHINYDNLEIRGGMHRYGQ